MFIVVCSFTHLCDTVCLSLFRYVFVPCFDVMFIFRSSVTHVCDAVLLSLVSYLRLPLCLMVVIVVVFCYSCLGCCRSVFI